MKIGALITNYDSWELTLHSLALLLKYQDGLHRCVVLDDCSESAMPEHSLLQHPIVEFRCNTQNLGYVRSVNVGVGLLYDCDIVLLLDCDSCLLTDPFPEILRRFQEKKLAALAMQEDMPGGSTRIAGEPEPLLIDFLLGQAASNFLGRLLPKKRRRFIAHSSSLIFRRTAFESVEGFDESFDFLDADVDFSMRLLDGGWQIEAAPELCCFHRGSGSPQSSRMRVARFHRNRFHLFKKRGMIRNEFLVQCILAMRHLVESAYFASMYVAQPSSRIRMVDKLLSRTQLLRTVWNCYET